MPALAQLKNDALASAPLARARLERMRRDDITRTSRRRANAQLLRDEYARLSEKETELRAHDEEFPPKRIKPGEERQPDPRRERIVNEIEALKRSIAAREQAHANERAVKTAAMVEAVLKKVVGIITDAPVEAQLRKGETAFAAIERLDAAIEAENANRKAILKAPRTKAEALAEANATIDAIAHRGAPRTMGMFHGGRMEFPQFRLPLTHGNAFQFGPDGVALVAWLFKDQLKARIAEIIAVNADDDAAMSREDQRAALAKSEAKLFELNRQRAAIVEMIAADGGEAYHRPDAPIEAVLQISIA